MMMSPSSRLSHEMVMGLPAAHIHMLLKLQQKGKFSLLVALAKRWKFCLLGLFGVLSFSMNQDLSPRSWNALTGQVWGMELRGAG